MNFFNLNVTDALNIWDGVKSRIGKTILQRRGSEGLDYSFITPSILALAKFQDDKIGELSQIIQDDSVVLWNLSGKPFSVSANDALNNQIIEGLWLTPGQFTQAPSLECLFSHCHSIKSWLDLDSNHVAIIYCGNGRSRSGILIACLLKQMKAFEQSSLAFDFFCSARSLIEVKPTVAPSYRMLFENIDQTVNHGGYPNLSPLHLKCVAISGLPVDEMPCVEVWDTTGVIFNSHTVLNKRSRCTWSAEYGDGFFRAAHDILGDFSVMCRFGGSHASTRDKTTLIFKYQNSTAFMAPEVIELNRSNVDINPEYSDSLDNELFTVHLMFEKSQEKDKTKVLPDRIFDGSGSVNYFEAGMNEISKHHIQEIDQVKNSMLIEMGLPERYTKVALQLANNNVNEALKYIQLMKQREKNLQNVLDSAIIPKGIKSKEQERLGSWNGDEMDKENNIKDSICRVCNDDNSMKKDQLIPCNLCFKYFHTTCCGARRIPFSLKTLKEKQNRDKFIKKHYSEWNCSTCSSPDLAEDTMTIHPTDIITNDLKISGTARRRSSLSNVQKKDVEFSTILPNYSQAWNPTMLLTGDVGYKKVIETEKENEANVSKNENEKYSKHDQVAFLIGILAASGYHIENLMTVSEEKQREALETATNHYNSKTCTPLKPKTESLEHVSSIGTVDNNKELTEKLQFLSSNRKIDEICVTSSSVLSKSAPKYEKYVKMTNTGVPLMAVAQKMLKEDVVNSIEQGVEIINQICGNKSTSASSTAADASFFLPISNNSETCVNALSLISLNESNYRCSTSSQQVKLSEHPQYAKFFRMLKSGLPMIAIKKNMVDAAVDVSIIDRNPDELIALQPIDDIEKVAVGSHPTYVKYFKMLRSGIPIEAIKNNMQRDKIDSTYLDREPNEMIPLNDDGSGVMNQKLSPINIMKSMKQSAVRKKRLHWKALDSTQVGFKDSVWANDKDDDIKLDEEEFNQLFVDSGDSQDIRKDKTIEETTKKKRINIIDMRRAQNGGISLARIRIAFPDVRTKIENMQDESFSTDQLLSLAEFLPMNDEQQLLKAYKGDIELLGPVEKYMIVMLNFPSVSDRILSMVYKQQFKGRVQECTTTLTKIENACDDVKMCSKLKKVLQIILRVGNQMNDGEEHAGFTLDSLLKLQSAKAFDKKTSILQYVIMLIQKSDESILQFPSDLPHISDASRLILDSVTQEGFQLRQGLHHAFELIKSIRNNEQGNGGDTSTMTEFLYKATKKCDELEESIEKAKMKFAGVVAYFGESPAMPSHDLFSTLSKFVQEFVVTRDAVIRKNKSDAKISNKENSSNNK